MELVLFSAEWMVGNIVALVESYKRARYIFEV